MTKRYLTRDEILKAPDLKTEEVAVPEWGGVVLVRGMTGSERDQFEASLRVGTGKKSSVTLENVRAKLVALTVVDEAGRPIFTEADIEALGKKSAAGLDRVYSVASRLCGLSDNDAEELAKN